MIGVTCVCVCGLGLAREYGTNHSSRRTVVSPFEIVIHHDERGRPASLPGGPQRHSGATAAFFVDCAAGAARRRRRPAACIA